MNIINDYIIIDKFNVEDLKKYKDDIISYYNNNLDTSKGGNSVYYPNEKFNAIVDERFTNIINKIFKVSEKIKKIKPFVYCQNNKKSINLWHHHIKTSTINGVFYLDPPENDGAIAFRYGGREYELFPKEGHIFLFPYWLEHTPLPQQVDKWRVCVNLEYKCMMRPTVKSTEVLW